MDCELENKILSSIRSAYSGDVYDYRGRLVDYAHVESYYYENYHRMHEIAGTLGGLCSGKKVLDIGIAYGFYDILLKEIYHADVTGMEVAENIPVYTRLLGKYGIPVIPGQLGVGGVTEEKGKYDFVVLAEVFEHLRCSPLGALKEIRDLLKPGGQFLLTTPNIARLSNLLLLLAGRNIVDPFPDDDSHLDHITDEIAHIREYTMKEMVGLFKRAGFEIKSARYSRACDRRPPRADWSAKKKVAASLVCAAATLFSRLRGTLFILAQKKD